MRRRVLIALAAVASVLLAAGPALAMNQYVALRNTQYNPKSVTIQQYDTIFWTHLDSGVQHSVTSAPRQTETFDSSPSCPPTCLQRGDTYKHTFRHAGTFTYFCRVHCPNNSCAAGGMRGTIVVKAFSTPSPNPTPEPTPAHASAAVSVTTPVPTPTPTPTPSPTPTVSPTPLPTPSASPSAVAAPKTTKASNRGLAVGFGIAAVALAALGGAFLFIRFRRPGL